MSLFRTEKRLNVHFPHFLLSALPSPCIIVKTALVTITRGYRQITLGYCAIRQGYCRIRQGYCRIRQGYFVYSFFKKKVAKIFGSFGYFL